MYAMLAGVDKAKIQAVKEYIVNANDKDLAQLFTEYFAEAVHLSTLPQNDDVKAQSAGIKMVPYRHDDGICQKKRAV